jgi:WD40 repeat protein
MHSTPEPKSQVFISYAHKDGATLANRLEKDLSGNGFNAWLDTGRLQHGASWTKAIEEALDDAGAVLALLSPESFKSEICRAEQLRALRKGKCVIPILVQSGTDVPLHLEPRHYLDFSSKGDYAVSLGRLIADLRNGNGAVLPEKFRTTYVTAPPLPVNFVDRTLEIQALRKVLLTDGGGHHVALMALEGMGGIGKTVLAQALCHDEVVQQAFPDGVIWVSIGKDPAFDTLTRMREVGKALGDDLSRYDNELGATNQYRSTIRGKAMLIVVDDIWNVSDLRPLLAESSPRSRLLFTTRDVRIAADVGAREHKAKLLDQEQAREILARCSGLESENLPAAANELIEECGRLPLALAMTGAMLRGKPEERWPRTCELFRNADLEKIRAQFPEYPHPNLFRAIDVSVGALDNSRRENYLLLAVVPEDMPAPVEILQCLWGLHESEATDTLDQFVALSLAQRDASGNRILLHDLQLDYARAQWTGEKKEALEILREAIMLSSHVIGDDPRQFASQMIGRLLPYRDSPIIANFLDRTIASTQPPWIRPLLPTLHPPGTSLRRTLKSHTDGVLAVALEADGKLAVSASADHTLIVWELGSGRKVHTLEGHKDRVHAVALTPNGELAVSASADHTLKVWSLASGQVVHTLEGHKDRIEVLALTGNGKLAVSTSWDRALKVWDLSSGRELYSLEGYSISGVAVPTDRELAVLSCADHTLKVWDLANGRELHTLEGHNGRVTAVAVTADGNLAVSGSDDHTLKVWNLSSGQLVHILEGHNGGVTSVALTEDGKLAISNSWDRTLKVWNLVSGQEMYTLEGHSIYGVAVVDGRELAVLGSANHSLKVWDLARGRELQTLEGHTSDVYAAALSSDGKLAVSASADHNLKIWDLVSRREVRALKSHRERVNAVALSSDGKQAVSASNDGTLKLWDLTNWQEVKTLEGHTDAINAVAVTADGKFAVSASADHTLKVWELASKGEMKTLEGHTSVVTSVALTSGSKLAVSGCWDGTLKVWHLANGQAVRTFERHTADVNAVALTPDGNQAASASADHTLKVWDLTTGKELHTLEGHKDLVNAVSVTSDGKLAVSASWDGTLRVWDLASGRAVQILRGHSSAVYAVMLTPDDKLAVSASWDQTLKIWDLPNGREVRTLEGHSGGVLSVALSADGNLVLSAALDHTLKVWDRRTGQVIGTFTCDGDPTCCAFVNDRLVIAGDTTGRVHFLSIEGLVLP